MKKLFCILMCISLCISLCGCYDSNEISQLAFIIAVGIDTSEEALYEYTFQAVKPSAFEGESDSDPLVTTTITSSTIYNAMDKLNTEISEKCDYSHIKLAVFSDELMKQGAKSTFESLFKTNTFHPNTRVAISQGKASEYLNNLKIPLDTNPAEYYENIFRESYSPYSPGTLLREMEAKDTHPKCNILPLVEAKSNEDDKIEKSNTEKSAIIKDYKLASVSEDKDAFWYKLVTQKKFKGNFNVKIPDTSKNAVVELTKTHDKIRVEFKNKAPVITLNIKLDGSVLWSESEKRYIANDEEFNHALKAKAEQELENFLYRCSQEYKTDICEFGKRAKMHYLTTESWQSEDWQGLFEKAKYHVSADITLRREGVSLK